MSEVCTVWACNGRVYIGEVSGLDTGLFVQEGAIRVYVPFVELAAVVAGDCRGKSVELTIGEPVALRQIS